jgi:hypothetical protein
MGIEWYNFIYFISLFHAEPMNQNFRQLISEAIHLEQNVGRLYLLFHNLLPEDSAFWWELALEEQNHAALLKTAEKMDSSQLEIPEGIMPPGVDDLKEANRLILKAMEDFKSKPDRTTAFQLAHKIELSAGESHYNNFMNNAPGSRITEILRRLNRDDLDHARRIREYMAVHHIT